MSTIKISQLPELTVMNSNTANVSFVSTDTETGITGRMTGTTLARGLYANNILNVGNTAITLPNTVAQFALAGDSYVQTNFVNKNDGGTADHVITANNGTDSTYFIDMGYANKDYQPGSEFNNIGTAVNRLDGYIYAQGSTGNTWGGNLIVGTTTTGKEIRFIAGGGTTSNVVAKMNATSIILNQSLVFPDGTIQNTSSGSAGSYANAAFIRANTPLAVTNSAFTQANAAFVVANNALANTTGTFGGDLTVTGNTIIKTSAKIQNAAITGNNQYLIITGTATGAIGIPSNSGYTVHTAVDGGNRVVAEAYSNTASDYASFIGRRARGTAANPLAVQNGDTIVRFGGNGFGATKFSQFSDGRIEVVATENHTDTARGTKIRFMNTMDGFNVASEIASFNANVVTFSGVVNPQKGVMYTPNVAVANATTYTLDFVRDSMVKYSVNDNSTITLQNYQPGKILEVWITNSAGQNKTITHGCLSNNSTAKSTSFTIQAGACAFLKYFSINGDAANTYVSITA